MTQRIVATIERRVRTSTTSHSHQMWTAFFWRVSFGSVTFSQ